ncbi:TonB-dependent receptor domain-containing protein [Providencia rustigianii]|uniref:TonB-dependent receptor domain-containing protein n=1 Tax=Providencia rustigianii TaxID=158850 RepID=UPI000F715085|nr:TonB-dependent receptor [Providencia rustigianii]VEH55209.1 Heme/hemopexin utilization protein C precursor [Providencia rustigianii]
MAFTPTSASRADYSYNKKFSLSTLTLAISITGFSANIHATQDVMHVTSPPLNNEKLAVAEQVEIIDATAPEHQTASSALSLLKKQTGIFISGAGSTYGESIQMRGYDSRGVKIIIDNVAQDFNSGLFDATFIDPSLISKAYIHKGSSSVQHGSGALAGVISLKTLNASEVLKPQQNLGGRVFSGINSNDHSYYAGATLLGRTDDFDALFTYSQRKKHLVASPDSLSFNNHEKIHNWMLKTSWLANPAYQAGLQLREYRNDGISLKQPSAIDTKNMMFANTPLERNTHQRDILINQRFTPQNQFSWQAEWDLYYTDLYLSQLDLDKIIKKPKKYGRESRNQYTYGTKFSNSLTVPVSSWAYNYIQSGFEHYQQKQTPNQYAISYPPTELNNTSGWLISDLTLQHLPITLSAGTRFTQYQVNREGFDKSHHTNWSSRFAVNATPTSWLSLHSSYAEGFRAPRMAELYNNSLHFDTPFSGTSNFTPTPDLQPETNKTLEAGLKLSFDDFVIPNDTIQFGSTYFTTKADNYIAVHAEYRKTIDRSLKYMWFPDEVYYINVPSATISGFDSFIKYQSQWFELSLNHNVTIAKEDSENHSLSSIRPETLTTHFKAPIASTGLNVGWIGEFSAKTAFTGDSTYKLVDHKSGEDLDRYRREIIQYAGYGVHDFYVSYQADPFIKGLNTALTMKNAFDREYISSMGVPQEGRNFYWNINYSW